MPAGRLLIVIGDQFDYAFVLSKVFRDFIGQINQQLTIAIDLGFVVKQNRCVEAGNLFGIVRNKAVVAEYPELLIEIGRLLRALREQQGVLLIVVSFLTKLANNPVATMSSRIELIKIDTRHAISGSRYTGLTAVQVGR